MIPKKKTNRSLIIIQVLFKMFNIKLNHFKKKSLKIMSSAHNKKPVTAPLMHVKGRTSDGSSQCTCIWETDMWCIVFSTQCTWVCSCSCYLQSLALFMPLPHVLFRVLVLKQSPSLIAKCQVELSAMLFFPSHSHLYPVFEVVLQCALNKFSL